MTLRSVPAVICSVALLVITGCNGSTNAAPAPAPAISNLSGDYTGTLSDTSLGSGSATATLAQNGASAGGTIVATIAPSTVNAHLSLSISTSNSVTGAIVIDEASATCTFSTTGTYNPSTNVLSGTYTAVSNCSGDTGNYSLTQQCTDTVTNPTARRKMGVIKC